MTDWWLLSCIDSSTICNSVIDVPPSRYKIMKAEYKMLWYLARSLVTLMTHIPHPLLQENLTDLNKRLGKKLPMDRFRPNIVISGAPQAWGDDQWKGIQISKAGGAAEGSADGSGVVLQYVKPCDRCKVPTINQDTAEAGDDALEKVLREVRWVVITQCSQLLCSVVAEDGYQSQLCNVAVCHIGVMSGVQCCAAWAVACLRPSTSRIAPVAPALLTPENTTS